MEPEADARSRVVVYVEFVKTVDSLAEAMRIHGIEPILCIGSLSAPARNKNLAAFANPAETRRVLILSAVGNVGLNLHMAQHLIFGDVVWSGQTQHQIIGRIHRQPNDRQVYVYVPRVRGTTDLSLSEMSINKEKLLDTFLSAHWKF